MQRLSGWSNDWRNIIRNTIFKDDELKSLMMLPEKCNIIDFRDKYFIKAGYTNTLLEDQKVRIVYADIQGEDANVPNVRKNMMTFDIYVKKDCLYNATNDRLQMRTQLIADRLLQLLTQERYTERYRFWIAGDWDLGTSTIGYARYSLALYYMKVY